MQDLCHQQYFLFGVGQAKESARGNKRGREIDETSVQAPSRGLGSSLGPQARKAKYTYIGP